MNRGSRRKLLAVMVVAVTWGALRVLQIGMPKDHPWWMVVEIVRWATLMVGFGWVASLYLRLEERARMTEYRLRRIAEEAEMLRIDFDLEQVAKEHRNDEPDVVL